MLFEMLALGCTLYVGYRTLKDADSNRRHSPSDDPGEKNSGAGPLHNVFKTPADEKSQQEEVDHDGKVMELAAGDRKAGFVAFALAAGGLFYRPLGILSVPFFFFSIKSMVKQSYRSIRKGKVDASTLFTVVLLDIVLLGKAFLTASLAVVTYHWVTRLKENFRRRLLDAFARHSGSVWIVVNGVEVSIPLEALKKGDIVAVRAGEIIPADGIVTEGTANIDQHILTGEAEPVEKCSGDEVLGSTIVLSGRIHVRVERAGEEYTVSRITDILSSAADCKSDTDYARGCFRTG
uniref:ATPase, P-type (Transporting), HAD superfamily, subfamily IC n=1 Tax=Candidatus Kentrum sp. FM TaxID=2126340 RepID=A0A450RZJ7_9GAMM|nr:MAG: ATPase, P-type (transporting), HAD superfamily, subfamily IC [Candidatus Kentron sp. FM]VFJ61628.1 MAG: ATPase, P-type (transporting), HAD superfamily, subfamily IC [Candidatus Kentron sp. FM]VFK14359.1 MAG: ATPase, P-type (transporting), HAD superfamily, subfamily IC [Candidatus Kentron sp. FM]